MTKALPFSTAHCCICKIMLDY